MKVETLIRGDVRVVKSYSLLLTYMYLAVNLIGFLDKILKVELVTKADLNNVSAELREVSKFLVINPIFYR